MATSLTEYIGATKIAADGAFIKDCETESAELVEHHIGTATVPESVKARAILEVGANLFYRRQAQNGTAGLDGMDMAPLRVTRDPLQAAYAMLRPYTGPGIA